MIEDAFRPDWACPPGITIVEILSTRGLTLRTFADQLGTTLSVAEELAGGSYEIDDAMAECLHSVLGAPVRFWIHREQQYRADIDRVFAMESAREIKSWLEELPVRDMVKFGWIECSKISDELSKACLDFFGVNDIPSWKRRYRAELAVAAFRSSASYPTLPGAVAAWLRRAELKSAEIRCAAWNREMFQHKLTEIRRLTRQKNPASFMPRLRDACAECGVAVVVAPAPNGCRASGATRFIEPGKAMIALSFRYRSDDQFWFTFFHEAGHLVLHSRDALFLEDESEVSLLEEKEANAFAAEILIPDVFVPGLMELRASTLDVIRFATTVGISPGIVVGQLQHRGRIASNRLNGLKRRFDWSQVI
jgi:HTH-type transcriptional regulator/antitoxin HigA